jgi:hypothetical protein
MAFLAVFLSGTPITLIAEKLMRTAQLPLDSRKQGELFAAD